MSKATVLAWIEKLVADHCRGHLVIPDLFMPNDCVSFWVKLRPSLERSAVDLGNLRKAFVDKGRQIPASNEGVLDKFGQQTRMWWHANRTTEERSHSKKINTIMSWLHGIRESFRLPETYSHRGHTGAIVVSFFCAEGAESAFCKDDCVGKFHKDGEHVELLRVDEVSAAFKPSCDAASKDLNHCFAGVTARAELTCIACSES
eukprot:TRINITY_DN19589_c0_g1_i1.p1 TRINITY_DN19589_c0_g1~~TRINITY_DN19589_c0_g1_i1.p1  ORF type:complete len:203 (+),score=35.27 TRINITY_DN19589_c0_g1_i1:955-1563(+)